MSYYKRTFLVVTIDSALILCTVILSYILRFEAQIPEHYLFSIPLCFLLIWMTTMSLFGSFKLHLRTWRYVTLRDLILIVKLITISICLDLLMYKVIASFVENVRIPHSIFGLCWILLIMSIGGSRFLRRFKNDTTSKIQPHHQKVMIIGAGHAGSLVAKELMSAEDTQSYPIAFIDDDPGKQKVIIFGIPVVGTRRNIIEQVHRLAIDTIIIAMPSVKREEIAQIITICKETKAEIKILPRIKDVIQGRVKISMLRDVRVEDLLGRDPIQPDNLKEMHSLIREKVILVTGAGGSIGSELCRQILLLQPRIVLLLGHGENSIYTIENELMQTSNGTLLHSIIADIKDRKRMEDVFAFFQPQVVFHAAAYKHVPLMEKNPLEAIKNNVFGTRNIAECAHLNGVETFVLVSTDKAVNPTSIMGVTKRISELIVQSIGKMSMTKFVAVRFGNVLGSRGSVIPLFKQQIEKGGPVTVTHPDMVRFFMTIPEAVQLVIKAGAYAKGGEIFILDMGSPVKIDDLANDLIRLSGLEPNKDIKIIYTGIRPGEKLYEEILTEEEGVAATTYDRIFIGKPADLSYDEVSSILTKMESNMEDCHSLELSDEILFYLYKLVPRYHQPMWKETAGRGL
ncbi:polysaccharide biosynthesis protein [Brevibacillus sp. SYSU BS000544]|uniref:polysaccharide biosynthesis protein n=1 Tax=Brevibacillus sp. SYSU BS000544 TaxID=3416443 RepID=UPI003CE5AB51